MKEMFPYEEMIKVHLIEAYLVTGKKNTAIEMLHDLEYFDHSIASKVENLSRTLKEEDDVKSKSLADRYKIKSALIVHSQQAMRTTMEGILKAFGFSEIHVCQNGSEAWNLCTQNKIDFVTLEWEIPGVSGKSPTKNEAMWLLGLSCSSSRQSIASR